MSALLEWTDILLASGSIIAAGCFTLLFKGLLRNYRRPNGKKGGIISFHATMAFALVTIIALTTKDWFLTGLAVLLAYIISRGRIDEGQHYTYQVVLGAIVGVLMPYGIFYLYHKRGDSDREEYNDKPERAIDDRKEADKHTDLRLEDPEL